MCLDAKPKIQKGDGMATLMIDDDVAFKVDEFAKKEDISREDFVNRAIRLYMHEKLMDELNEHGRRLGITEEVIAEEIKRAREERRLARA
jgi:metal-responsive CopG/Arc/MetJ family transcriptional regulator